MNATGERAGALRRRHPDAQLIRAARVGQQLLPNRRQPQLGRATLSDPREMATRLRIAPILALERVGVGYGNVFEVKTHFLYELYSLNLFTICDKLLCSLIIITNLRLFY